MLPQKSLKKDVLRKQAGHLFYYKAKLWLFNV
jgi:hypothetical protein